MATKNKAVFTIRRIANRNPRLARFYRSSRQKIWRLAVVVFLAVAGIASLFFFQGNFVSQTFESRLLKTDASEILGPGFEDITKFTDTATNASSDKKGGGFTAAGIGWINAVLYNVKDYFKYVAGSVALLYLVIAALQILLSQNEEGIKKGKQNLFFSVVALVLIFMIDVVVVTFFEGGGTAPGQSLVTFNEVGTASESLSLFKTISAMFKENARLIFSYLKTITGSATILFIIFAGVQMVTAGGSEEKIEKEKKYIIHILTAFVTVLLLDTMIFGFIYPDNTSGASDPICVEFMNYTSSTSLNAPSTNVTNLTQFAKNYGLDDGVGLASLTARIASCKTAAKLGLIGSNQIIGIVRFFETLVGAVAVLFMVYSGTAIIASMGNDEIIKKHRTTLLWSVVGLVVVILSNLVITKFFFVVDPTTGQSSVTTLSGVKMLSGITNFVASFVGIFSVVSMVVAGFMWVANFGNDDLAGKAKKVILSAVIGVVLSISAYAIVNTITQADSEGGSGTSVGISI